MFSVLTVTGSIHLWFRRRLLHCTLADTSVGSINNSVTEKSLVRAGRGS